MSERPYHILIVDDSPEDRLTYRRFLEGAPLRCYVIAEADLGEEGLRLCAASKPDCVLLDYRLPDLDGLEFLAGLQERGKDLPPVVMLTGQGSEEVAVEAMKRGAQDYLVKGTITPDRLRHAVAGAIEKVTLRRQVEEQRRELERLAAELRRHAEQLAEVDRRKDIFLATLAHELRNSLAPLRNALGVLAQPDAGTAAVQWGRELMDRQVRQMSRLIDDLLDISRINQGKLELRKEPIELARVVTRSVESTRPLLDERRHQLTVRLPDEPVWVEADPVRLEQVLTNLLTNAAKYTAPGGQVFVGAGREGPEAVLRVRDNGFGIPPEMRERIFEMFAQIDRPRSGAAPGGLGIGLTLVRQLVEMHGGRVEVASEGPGRGSEFMVRLPARPAPPAPVATASAEGPAPPPPRRRVLVVDDNVDSAATLALLLRCWGHEVREAHSGPEALAVAGAFAPEVVLLDISLPGMDGYQVARQLRQLPGLQQALLVALTGHSRDEDRHRSREAGFDHHLIKPVEPEELEELLTGISQGIPAGSGNVG
ncbi:MAG TPA: response regulator [Gemmataceae bacterium]|nr:response regulator [Gemmataceae bacterium]